MHHSGRGADEYQVKVESMQYPHVVVGAAAAEHVSFAP